MIRRRGAYCFAAGWMLLDWRIGCWMKANGLNPRALKHCL